MSRDRLRVVLDTGVLISRALRPGSVPANAVDLAKSIGDLLVSHQTLTELGDVLSRPKFKVWLDPIDTVDLVEAYAAMAELVTVIGEVAGCRDPDDDKFLSLALAGSADVIVTGDDDLLVLNPFQSIVILTPRQFLDAFSPNLSSPATAPRDRERAAARAEFRRLVNEGLESGISTRSMDEIFEDAVAQAGCSKATEGT